MVVKGLDFQNVLLVGVINADNMLNFPDFESTRKELSNANTSCWAEQVDLIKKEEAYHPNFSA